MPRRRSSSAATRKITQDKKSAAALRARAEGRIGAEKRRAAAAVGAMADAHRMVHELDVHRAELAVQNDELLTARGETEDALARYTELFDFAPIGYAMLGPDAAIRELNHAGARLLGKPRARAIGARFAAFVAAGSLAVFDALLCRAAAGGAPASCELELAIGGRTVDVRLTAVEVARARRTILLAFEDISERVAREQELARAEQALREAGRRKDEFLGVLSHELRNPLGPISGSLFILDHVAPGSRQAVEARAILDRQVTHLTRLIEDLLDVTRIARGKIELQREHVELGELLRRTIADHRAGFERCGIRLEARLGGEPLWLDADPARLVQIASNLLGNAEKFTPAGGTVTVSVERRGGRVALRVRDTGAGIAPELIPSVFEPFAQAPQAIDRGRGGLGLGLTTVKGMVELHGGTVEVASAGIGRGTEVVVCLPLDGAPVPADGAVECPAAVHRRVLLIDDSADVVAALAQVLRLLGHDVQVADRGAAGLELARAFRPETVICDLGLPEMDGYAVAAAFRADPALQEMHLIALSGYARAEDRRRTVAAGFDHHVAKPPDMQRLDRLIAEGRQAADVSSPAQRRTATATGRVAASS